MHHVSFVDAEDMNLTWKQQAGRAPVFKEEEEDLEIKLRHIIDVCVSSNTLGSSTGSGSGDFHQHWFVDLFNYYVNFDDQELFSMELQLDTKVSEASVSRNLVLSVFLQEALGMKGGHHSGTLLAEINESSRLFILPNLKNSESPEHLVGLSDDDEIGNLGDSKVIRVVQHRFFFDLRSNNRGHFLRIYEVAGSDRSSIILPLSGLELFNEVVGHFVEITEDRIEGMPINNVRTIVLPLML
ncbi:hypothetical protein TanjilG_27979 [Lupinus angustifolius]|uniref:Uncharacterized protein n=1 Tax=Lupinus angustifolius TaxID=3871 RepID=A0A4P1RFV8_LUPAN|nr:hypothetical protein TanjilG_27979 [Lupinus angustifolius]